MNYNFEGDLTILLSYGITFGILLMTIFLLSLGSFTQERFFIYFYSLMQVFSLVFIISYSELFLMPEFIKELSLLLATFCALIFSIGFYKGKFFPEITNTKELIINTFLIVVVLSTAFYHYVLFEYLPYTIIYGILFISIIFNLKTGFKPIIVYVVGWSIFCLVLFIMDFKTLYYEKNFIDIVLVAFAIEAILFTVSVGYKYNVLKKENKEYENMLLHQSRLAKTGEMIGNITHQFRQPLNNISYILMNLKKRFTSEKLDEIYFDKKISQANEQLDFLSKTIEDFKEFYAPSKLTEDFEINEAIENVMTIFSADVKKSNIEFQKEFKTNDHIKITGIKNELSQVLLALLSNARDSLSDIESPKIKLEVDATSAEVIVKIFDNGKGIKEKDIKKIFDPYFSTKNEGTGLGLYLVKVIIEESFNGKVLVENQEEGVCFSLFFEKTI